MTGGQKAFLAIAFGGIAYYFWGIHRAARCCCTTCGK